MAEVFGDIISGVKKTTLILIFISIFLVACSGNSADNSSSSNTSDSGSAAFIENKGSDTIVNLALAWAEEYQSENGNVRISVTGGGSGTGLAALVNGTVDIANASRQIKPEEIEQVQANGTDPIEFVIARDAIAAANRIGTEQPRFYSNKRKAHTPLPNFRMVWRRLYAWGKNLY